MALSNAERQRRYIARLKKQAKAGASERKRLAASRREIARLVCKDCGVNVAKIGEYCMIDPAIWVKRLGMKLSDNLCIGCIEARLGRKLGGRGDFISWPVNPGGFNDSDRYTQRLFGDKHLAITKLKHGEPLPRGWKWKKERGHWWATDGHCFIRG